MLAEKKNGQEWRGFMLHQKIDIFPAGKSLDSPAGLYTYLLDSVTDRSFLRPAVIICPGGGYCFTSDREAEPIALQMTAKGFHTFVLRYRVAPHEYPAALLDLAESVKYIREHAKEWSLDANKIFVAGFSAGGHLACSLSVFWGKKWLAAQLNTENKLIRPNGCLLAYPVITSGSFAHRDSFQNLLGSQYEERIEEVSLEKQVNAQMPPVFLWHTFTDPLVSVENSLLLVDALRKYQIPTEFHMYPVGGHGLALATEETMLADGQCFQPECAGWIQLAADWIKRQ